jgi:predicted nucleic acid-binding protein
MSKPVEVALADTGFWFAICDPHDPHHPDSGQYEDYLELVTIVIPWPSMYETLNSRFVKRSHVFSRFESCLKKCAIEYVDDHPYRNPAYEQTMSFARIGKRPFSLVDMIIRFMLDDDNLKKRYLLTFNKEDFRDVCFSKRVEML